MKRLFKKTGGIIAIIAAFLLFQGTGIVNAWGPERPEFTMEHPASYVTFNSITDNQSSESVGIGDERNFVRVRKTGETTFTDKVEISETDISNGQEFEVYVFYHNNAASNYHLTAEDTKVFAYFPGIIAGDSTGETGAKISASNAKPKSVWDEADFINKSSVGVRLKYVEDSATIYWNGGATTAQIGEDLFTTGALIGYCEEGGTDCASQLNGKVPGCAEYSGYIIYKVRVEQASIYLSKMASTDGINYYDNVTARVGDTIHYKVVAKNLGSVATTQIAIKDQLTTGLEKTTDAILKDTATEGATKTEALSSDFFTSTGAQAYQLSVGGAGWYIEYDAKITQDALGGQTCGASKLINTVYMDYALADGGYGTLGNQAAVLVSAPCEEESVKDCTTNPELPGCEKTCITNPEMEGCQELPKTGPLEITLAVIIAVGMISGGYYLYRTKKTLRTVENDAKGEEKSEIVPEQPTPENKPEEPQTPQGPQEPTTSSQQLVARKDPNRGLFKFFKI